MKKLLLIGLPVIVLAACSGSKCHHKEHKRERPRPELTQEQHNCLRRENCRMPEKGASEARRAEFRVCRDVAFEACRIEKWWEGERAEMRRERAKR